MPLIDITYADNWTFLCFYAQRMARDVIPGNLLPTRSPDFERLKYFWSRHDYDKAYANFRKNPPETFMAELEVNEIRILMTATAKEIVSLLSSDYRMHSITKPLERLAYLNQFMPPDPPPDNGEG